MIEVGDVIEGTITKIMDFGAFIDMGEGIKGLLHISQISREYVRDINAYLKVKDKIKLKVISKGKKGFYDLSLIALTPPEEQKKNEHRPSWVEKQERPSPPLFTFNETDSRNRKEPDFESMLSRFLKESDERLLDLKKNIKSKTKGKGRK